MKRIRIIVTGVAAVASAAAPSEVISASAGNSSWDS
jgi:hypothetical protein